MNFFLIFLIFCFYFPFPFLKLKKRKSILRFRFAHPMIQARPAGQCSVTGGQDKGDDDDHDVDEDCWRPPQSRPRRARAQNSKRSHLRVPSPVAPRENLHFTLEGEGTSKIWPKGISSFWLTPSGKYVSSPLWKIPLRNKCPLSVQLFHAFDLNPVNWFYKRQIYSEKLNVSDRSV